MRNVNRWVIAAAFIVPGLQLSGCAGEVEPPHSLGAPAHVEKIAGSDVSRVTLTSKAMERLDLKTAPVRAAETQVAAISDGDASPKTSVPYSAVFYGVNGKTWVYTSPETGEFIRHLVKVDNIRGDEAILSEGPPIDTQVATVGVAEIFGTESGIGGH